MEIQLKNWGSLPFSCNLLLLLLYIIDIDVQTCRGVWLYSWIMGKFKRVCVFCGSNLGNKKIFSDAALDLGIQLVSFFLSLSLLISLKIELLHTAITYPWWIHELFRGFIGKAFAGGEENGFSLWRRELWVDGSGLSDCSWWWMPCSRVSYLQLHNNKTCNPFHFLAL